MKSAPQSPSPNRRCQWIPGFKLLLAAYFAAAVCGHAAVADIVSWTFATANPDSPPVANLGVSELSRGNNNPAPGTVPLVTTTSPSSGYAGASGDGNAGVAARTGVLITDDSGSAYFEFTITPQNDASVSLTDIDFGTRSTGTGPQAYAIRSSLDAYVSDLAGGTIANNNTWALKTNPGLTIPITSARTFRIYGYNGSGSPTSNTTNWRIDDLALTVFVTGGASDRLTLVLASGTIQESGSPSVTLATVTRSGIPPFGGDLTADVAVSDPTVATAPATVVVSGTTGTGTFVVTAVDDSLADGDQAASVTVSSAGFIPDSKTITVQNDADSPLLIINEILGMAATDTNGDGIIHASDDEFIELVNISGANLDISGWTVSDNAQVRHTFPPATVLVAGQAVVVFGGGIVASPTMGNALAFRSTSGQLGLNNTGGDSVTIRDGTSTYVTSASYTGDISAQAASFNLLPEKTFGSPYVVHSTISGALGTLSPGRRADGTEFIALSPLTLGLSQSSITENGGTSIGTVTRPGGTTGALMVFLASSDISEATVPPTVEIPDGQSSATFTISGADDIEPDGPINVTITASALGFAAAQINLEVTSDTDAVSPATLATGAIAFVAYNADGGDDFAFVTLTTIPEGTRIRFTDNEWNGLPMASGGLFNIGEGFASWVAPSGGVPAGTVIQIRNTGDSTAIHATIDGTTAYGIASGSVNMNGSDETLYAYQGTELRASGFLSVIATHTADSVAETGLTASHLIYLPDDVDVAEYISARSSKASFAAYLPWIADTSPSHWVTQDGAADNSYDGTAPDVPFSATAFSIATGGGFASWIAGHPAVGALTGPNDDFDHDGLDNLLENILGSDPAVGNAGPGIVSGTATSVTFRHSRSDSPAADLTSAYEWSADLATWHPSGASDGITVIIGAPTIVTDGTPNDLVEVTASVTNGTTAKLFVRIKVSQP